LKHRIPFTSMRDFAQAMKKAARKLYGRKSAEVIATHNAFAAVGLFNAPINPTPQKKPQTKKQPAPPPPAQQNPQPAKNKPKPPTPPSGPVDQPPEPGNTTTTRSFTISGMTFAIIFVVISGAMILAVSIAGRRKTPRKQHFTPQTSGAVAESPVHSIGKAPATVAIPIADTGSSVSCVLSVANESFNLTLDNEPLCLGRAASDLPAKLLTILNIDETISRQHCEIWYQAKTDELVIKCLSGNGLVVNSSEISKGQKVSIRFNTSTTLKLGNQFLTLARV